MTALVHFLIAVLVGGGIALSCTGALAQSAVIVFAAASTKNALDALAQQYESNGHSRPVISYAASSVLARQIDNGAPAGIYISASVQWMDYLAQRERLLDESRFTFARNRLVLVAAPDASIPDELLPVRNGMPLLGALGAGARLALANPSHVPAGQYARSALQSLEVWDALAGRLAPANNVRFALAMVARGEAPLGLVYRSDLYAGSAVRELAVLPADLHEPIRYPAAAVRQQSSHASAAVSHLLQYLQSPASRLLINRYGFGDSTER